MFDKIMKADISFPPFMSNEAKDILSKLLERDPEERLGSGESDASELKVHPFFRAIDWNELSKGNIRVLHGSPLYLVPLIPLNSMKSLQV